MKLNLELESIEVKPDTVTHHHFVTATFKTEDKVHEGVVSRKFGATAELTLRCCQTDFLDLLMSGEMFQLTLKNTCK